MSLQLSSIIYSLIAGLATLAGIALLLLNEKWAIKNSHYLNSFAAGIIAAVAFFHLIPESLELNENGIFWVFIGFIIFYLLESIIVIHSGTEIHQHEEMHRSKIHRKGIISFYGLFFHSFLDGIIIALGFEVSFKLGLLSALGVILHELPEGTTSFSLLISTLEKKKALLLSIFVAVATPIGTILSIILLKDLADSKIGLLIGMAGGSFLYISASDLIPETHEKNALQNAICLILGVIFIIGLSSIFNI